MADDETPIGQLFSQVYIARGEVEKDSARFRRRMGAYVDQVLRDHKSKFADVIQRELGVDVPWIANWGPSIPRFFEEAEIRDVLDSITLIWRTLVQLQYSIVAHHWLSFVQRALHEESLGYRLDERAGIHYFVDEEFERNRAATLESLADAKYAAVAAEFEQAHRCLDQEPADTKGAIRAVFDAIEILVKLVVAGKKVSRLGATEVDKHLKPLAQRAYANDPTARTAANQLLSSLSNWINSAHQYRHGQKVHEPAPPPLNLAVAMVSLGATYLRWLVEIERLANR